MIMVELANKGRKKIYSPMSIVEENLFDQGAHNNLIEKTVEGRQNWTEVTTSPHHHKVSHIDEWNANNSLVEKHPQHSFLNFALVNLWVRFI